MRHTADPRPVKALQTTERETREQAYVPAEQPSPAQGPRIPPAHAHPCRSRDPVLASPQGPQEPVGLSRPSRPGMRPCRVRPTGSPGARSSRSRSGRVDEPAAAPSSCIWRCPDSEDRPRVGFVVSRAVGNAVTRNRVKRRLRELVRGAGRRPPERVGARRAGAPSVRRGVVRGTPLRPGSLPDSSDLNEVCADRPAEGLPRPDQPDLRAGLPLPPLVLGLRPGGGDRARQSSRQLARRTPSRPLPPLGGRRVRPRATPPVPCCGGPTPGQGA